MDTLLFKDYGIIFSDKLREKIATPEAQKFTADSLKYCFRVFENIKMRLPPTVVESIRLDAYLHVMAVHSAYLDLWQSDNFHELEEGPSPSKKGAALTCWINRIKPIQLKNESGHSICGFLNAIFAFEVGWSVMAHSKMKSIGEVDKICDHIRAVMKETDLDNLFVYTLVWRSPGFRELSTLFELIR